MARCELSKLQDPKWDRDSGGVHRPTARPYIFGYIACDAFVEGSVAHSCRHGDGPHRIKVCVMKKHSDPKAFAWLRERVGEPPR